MMRTVPSIGHPTKEEAWLKLNQIDQEERSETYDLQTGNRYRELEERGKKEQYNIAATPTHKP